MSIFVVSFMQDDDEDYNNDEDGRLSKSGNELKKLLGRLNKSDTEDDDDNDNADGDGDDDIDDVIDKDPLKAVPSGTSQITPSTSQGKRKSNDDEAKAYTGAPHKKAKTENGQKPSVKEEPASDSLVTEEIKAVLMQQSPITVCDLLNNFPGRLRPKEEIRSSAPMQRKLTWRDPL
ncbi:transcription initiation factor IIF subunit alpha-like isoform X2 [Rosa rugosa]|uniref:transcription initiation factor IIF subunit alpha-like isoform X2 n=1 Tax=Rosa rugosa TaxID=74645 RepID=UPI002B40E090|nr:transcription initiation factor IIF subunit alpha-like isoform X2 [Rosa rugosa]